MKRMSLEPDIAVIVTVHHEGRLMTPTFRALARCIGHALEQGYSTEVAVVFDRPDDATEASVEQLLSHGIFAKAAQVTRVPVDHGDLGLARNAGIRQTSASRVTVLDADNLPSRSWLAEAAKTLDKLDEPAVVHPERILTFDGKRECWPLRASTDPQFHLGDLLWFNTWDAFAMSSREVVDSFPYPQCRPGDGFGPEDWAWNCTTLAAGVQHHIAIGTTLFYQVKPWGSLADAHGDSVLPQNDILRAKSIAAVEIPRLTTLMESTVATPPPHSPRPFHRLRERSRIIDTGYRAARYLARPALERIRSRHTTAPAPDECRVTVRREVAAVSQQDWEEAHLLQPLVPYPTDDVRSGYGVWGTEWDTQLLPDRLAYWHAVADLPEHPDLVFIVPWIGTGGADLLTVQYVQTARRLRPEASIAVITTEPQPSTRLDALPDDVVVFDLGRHHLLPQFATRLLGILLTQLAPQTLHVINSTVGFDTVDRYGRVLSHRTNVFLSTYVVDRLADGATWSFLYNRSRDFYTHLRRVLTDNEAFVTRMIDETGAPPEAFRVVHQVVEGGPHAKLPARFTSDRPLRMLWCGRFDEQKRLDRLASVFETLKAEGVPVTLDYFGEAVIGDDHDWNDHCTRLNAAGAVQHPPYRGDLRATHPERFDALVMTSDREGVPNTMLEGLANGLVVIATKVGGVSEVLTPEIGYPVTFENDTQAIRQLVDAVKEVIEVPGEAASRVSHAEALVHAEFSSARFMAELEGIEGYLPIAGGAAAEVYTESRLHYYADAATSELLQKRPCVLLYTGSNGHSNFGDILQNKNVLAYWNDRGDAIPVLLMPAHAGSHERHQQLADWYTPHIVYFSEEEWRDRSDELKPMAPHLGMPLLHVIGGGYLNSLWGQAHLTTIDDVSRDWRIGKVIMSGLQVDATACDQLQRLIAGGLPVSTIGVRDEPSLSYLHQAQLDDHAVFTFDDLTEVLQQWAEAREPQLVKPRAGLRYAVHMNTSDYAGGSAALDRWRTIVRQLAETTPDEIVFMHAYADTRPEVQDTLDTIAALAEDFPLTKFPVVNTAQAALGWQRGDSLPEELEGLRGVTAAFSSSYHTALFMSFLGTPAYLVNATPYFAQKAALFSLPSVSEFLHQPDAHLIRLDDQLNARESWLRRLDSLAVNPR